MDSGMLLCLFWLSVFFAGAIAYVFASSGKRKLPPGPPAFPIIGNLFWLGGSFRLQNLESLLLGLRSRYGSIITLRIGSAPAIFIADSSLAHKALIENGSAFADRPSPNPSTRFLTNSQRIISAAPYGSAWRILRRSLISDTIHPSRLLFFADGRRWVLAALSDQLRSQSEIGGGVVEPKASFQFAVFCLLVLMCFGEKLGEKAVREIEAAQRNYLIQASRLTFLSFFPGTSIAPFFFRSKLRTAMRLRQKQKEIFSPLIRARRERKNEISAFSYVDSLIEVELPEEDGGKVLDEDDLVALCSEFLNAGTDTTSTSLQWIMAELAKNQGIQHKLREEIESVVGSERDEVNDGDLPKMPYLKAVIMEGLRLHPPGHFVLPHSVTRDTEFEGYLIPKNASVNFVVSGMALDEKNWEEPMVFEPGRFMAGGSAERVDITGSREIKMMPFGAGRRICPGMGLAMLHLEYFVANLVKAFEWRIVEGEDVDLSEKIEFTSVMKNSLRTHLVSRKKSFN